MPRPPKWRRVEFLPEVNYFKPAGIPLREIEEVQLPVEELEAIRLKDYEGLEQEACAKRMGVSRPTFHRILASARSTIAEALITGKAIRVEGGNFRVAYQNLRCNDCGHEWEFTIESVQGAAREAAQKNAKKSDREAGESGEPAGIRRTGWANRVKCPTCGSANFQPLELAGRGIRRRFRGRRWGGNEGDF